MSLRVTAKTPSSWREGTTYDITISFYVVTEEQDWDKTTLKVFGENIRFVDATEESPRTLSLIGGNSGGANASLNYSAYGLGNPTVSTPWEVTVRATGAQGARGENIQIIVTAIAENIDGVAQPDSGQDNLRVTLQDSQGSTGPPPQPTNFKAKAVGPEAIELSWAKVDGANEIEIDRATNADFDENLFTWSVGGSATKYTDYETSGIEASVPALAPETTYYYRIRGKNNDPNSPGTDSATRNATTPAAPAAPEAPTQIKAVPKDGASVLVSFKPIDSIKVQTEDGKVTLQPVYKAFYSTVEGGPYTGFGGYVTQKSIRVTGLLSNTLYYFVVKSGYEFTSVVSANSEETSATTGRVSGSPNALGSFTATAQPSPNETDIELTWTDTNAGTALTRILRKEGVGGTYSQIVELAAGITSYMDINLSESTQYFYQAYAFIESVGNSSLSSDDATTGALPATPAAPTIIATPSSDTTISIDINGPDTTEEFYEVFRGTDTGGPYTSVGRIMYPQTHFADSGLTPNTTFFYVAQSGNRKGNSANSSESSATTFQRSATWNPQSNFSMDPQSTNEVVQILGRAIVTSNLDRWVVFMNGYWYQAGLKRQLLGPTCSAQAGGALADGVYTVYSVLLSQRRGIRSLPSEAGTVTLSGGNNTIRVIPELEEVGGVDVVEIRDTAYNIAGDEVFAADYIEFYVASATSIRPFLVAQVPVNDPLWEADGYYDIDPTLTADDIFNGTRRPMEIYGESSLPPACAVAEAKDNRLVCFGEMTIAPTDTEIAAGASIAISQGDTTFTVSNFDINDAVIYHQLYINGEPTGWEIYDREDDTCYIRHADIDINRQGWQGLGGTFSDFAFAANPSRVYYSAFFTGEGSGDVTYSPETFPPLTHFESPFFPQDNTDPIAMITSNADLLVGKPSKWMRVLGGSEPDVPLIAVQSLSQNSGVNAPNTLCLDSHDVAYYLADTGPFSVSANGVEKLTVQTGNQKLFQTFYDIDSVAGAVGTWYSSQDWFVCIHLNRIGNHGYRDGFIYDPNLQVICPFDTPYEITWTQEVKNIFGDYQIMFGTSDGYLGILFKKGLSVDSIDDNVPSHGAFSTPISGYVRGPIEQTPNRITVRGFQPYIFVKNGGVMRCAFEVAKKERMDDPRTFNTQKSVTFSTDDTRTFFSVGPHKYPNCVLQFEFTMPMNPTDSVVTWRDFVVETVQHGPL